MIPLSMLATQKVAVLLLQDSGLQVALAGLEVEGNLTLPAIANNQIVISSSTQDTADKNVQLTYPRIALYSDKIKNVQTENLDRSQGRCR